MDLRKCTVCGNMFEGKDASILTMSGFGNARYICPECSELLDTATLDKDYDNIKAAVDKLSDRVNIDVADSAAFNAYTAILDGAKERAQLIKCGEYDFSLDEAAVDEFEEVPEELKESEEDRALDEKEAKQNALMDKITSWVYGVVFAGAIIYFIITLFLK